jgi:hypothetical protein
MGTPLMVVKWRSADFMSGAARVILVHRFHKYCLVLVESAPDPEGTPVAALMEERATLY